MKKQYYYNSLLSIIILHLLINSITAQDNDDKYARCFEDNNFNISNALEIDAWEEPIDKVAFQNYISNNGHVLHNQDGLVVTYLIRRAKTPDSYDAISKRICQVDENSNNDLSHHDIPQYWYYLYLTVENKSPNTIYFKNAIALRISMYGEDNLNDCSTFLCAEIGEHQYTFGNDAKTEMSTAVYKMGANSKIYGFEGAWHYVKPQLYDWSLSEYSIEGENDSASGSGGDNGDDDDIAFEFNLLLDKANANVDNKEYQDALNDFKKLLTMAEEHYPGKVDGIQEQIETLENYINSSQYNNDSNQEEEIFSNGAEEASSPEENEYDLSAGEQYLSDIDRILDRYYQELQKMLNGGVTSQDQLQRLLKELEGLAGNQELIERLSDSQKNRLDELLLMYSKKFAELIDAELLNNNLDFNDNSDSQKENSGFNPAKVFMTPKFNKQSKSSSQQIKGKKFDTGTLIIKKREN